MQQQRLIALGMKDVTGGLAVAEASVSDAIGYSFDLVGLSISFSAVAEDAIIYLGFTQASDIASADEARAQQLVFDYASRFVLNTSNTASGSLNLFGEGSIYIPTFMRFNQSSLRAFVYAEAAGTFASMSLCVIFHVEPIEGQLD